MSRAPKPPPASLVRRLENLSKLVGRAAYKPAVVAAKLVAEQLAELRWTEKRSAAEARRVAQARRSMRRKLRGVARSRFAGVRP